MKKFLNLALVAGAAISLSACACVKTVDYGNNQTVGAMPTSYDKDCTTRAKGGSGDKVFSGKQRK